MIEFLADKMYELITTKGIEAIEQLKSQYNNQVILYGIIKRFGEGDYFKQEYSCLTYIDRQDNSIIFFPHFINQITILILFYHIVIAF